jgi:uncharacterized membrane protein YdjX (TVP38/TMEM64 family)
MSRKTPLLAWVLIGNVVAYAVGSTLFEEFARRAKTEDWVLEYRAWIEVSVWIVSALVVVGFVLFGVALRRRQEKKDL